MLVPFAVTALLELVPTAQSSSHLPTLPFTLPGIHFLNLEELPETARLQLEPPLAVSFSESSFCHSSHPWSNVQYFGKTRKEGKINYILASGPFLPQIINFHVTLVSYSILTSLSYRMCYPSILGAVSAVPAGLYFAVVRRIILPIHSMFGGNILGILGHWMYFHYILK